MKLQIVHHTLFEYEGSVVNSFNETRLRPLNDATQQCLEFRMLTEPGAVLRSYHDFFGNHVEFFEINHTHARMSVQTRCVVETNLNNPFDFSQTVSFESLQDAINRDALHDYLIESPYIPLTPELWRCAMDLHQPGTDVWQTVLNINDHLHRNLTYHPGSTTVHTSATEALAQKSGVCQDFAHIMIGILRSLKIPARYVSGYIYESDDMLQSVQRGRQTASHAWCEVFLPGVGWRSVDPTNNLVVNDHYVKLAVGRDYSDATPLKGTYRGPKTRSLQVSVTVRKLASDGS